MSSRYGARGSIALVAELAAKAGLMRMGSLAGVVPRFFVITVCFVLAITMSYNRDDNWH